MITIFNREELTVTFDLNRLNKIREILSTHKIPYFTKTTNMQSAAFMGSNRARTGSFGIDPKFSYEYQVYVLKKDYAKACHLIGK